jgi:hypothetical protein
MVLIYNSELGDKTKTLYMATVCYGPMDVSEELNYFREKFQNVLFLAYTNPTSDDLLWRQNNVIGSDVIHMRMLTAEVIKNT